MRPGESDRSLLVKGGHRLVRRQQAFAGAGGGLTPSADVALRSLAVALMLGGAAMLLLTEVSSGIAIPFITVGIALVVLAEAAPHRRAP
jgi:hypothetical protein